MTAGPPARAAAPVAGSAGGLSRGWWLPATLGAAFATRLVVFGAIVLRDHSVFFSPDSQRYWDLAGNLAAHGVFSAAANPPFLPEHYRTPAYPLFIALFRFFDAAPWAVILAQILLSVGVCLLAARAAGAFGGDRPRAALLAGLLCALDVPSIVHANLLMSEVLFTVFLFSALLLVLPSPPRGTVRPLLAGVLLGCALLTRPLVVWLPFLIAALLSCSRAPRWRERLRAPALLLTGFLLVLLPWLARNTHSFGRPFIASVAYDYLLYVHGGGVISVLEEIPYREAKGRLVREFEASPEARGGVASVQRAQLARAKAILLAHPLIAARNFIIGSGYSLFSPLRRDIDLIFDSDDTLPTLQTWGGESGVGRFAAFLRRSSPLTLAVVLFQALHLLLLYGGALLCIARRRVAPTTAALFLLVVAYFCLTSGGPESYARFRVPLVPLLAILAAVAYAPEGEAGPKRRAEAR